MASRFRDHTFVASLLRAVIFALLVPIGSSGSLPVWAELAGIEGLHVCHCSADHHDCVCARCNPDRDHDDGMILHGEELTGRCGDDAVAFGGRAIVAIPPLVWEAVPAPAARLPVPTLFVDPVRPVARPPPTPPPRHVRSFQIA